jgi:hypothetical protein
VSTLETNALLEKVLDVLGEIKDRLPEPTKAEDEKLAAGSVVVTGEAAGEGVSPVTAAKRGPGRPRKNTVVNG